MTPPVDRASRARRRVRDYIAEFGAGRGCVVPGCRTVLSKYHSGELCWVHDEPRKPSQLRKG